MVATIFVVNNGLRWRDAPYTYGPHKAIYNRFIRWSCMGVFNRIVGACRRSRPDCARCPHLNARRMTESFLQGEIFPDLSGGPKAA